MTDLPFPRMQASASPEVSVRPARPGDAEAVADVQLTVWRTAYADLLPDLAALDRADMVEQWRTSIAAPPSSHHLVLVAVEAGSVVGVAVASPLPDDTGAASRTSEIADLLVHPGHTRSGHGSRLLAATVDHVRGQGDRMIATWCARDDDVRRTFLESAGFAVEGTARHLDMGPGTTALVQERLVAGLD